MITNNINGKCYVGQTSNVDQRQEQHFEKSHNIHLRRSIAKYGKENFDFSILTTCKTKEEVNSEEIRLIEEHKAFTDGYNLTQGGEGGNTLLDPEVASKHSLATSKGKIGKKRDPFNDKWKAKLAKVLLESEPWKKRSKPVLVEGIEFCSQHEASRQLGISQPAINYRLKRGVDGYKYL